MLPVAQQGFDQAVICSKRIKLVCSDRVVAAAVTLLRLFPALTLFSIRVLLFSGQTIWFDLAAFGPYQPF